MTTVLVPAGFQMVEYLPLGSDGYPTLSNGSSTYPTQVIGAKTSSISIPEGETLTPTGDDGSIGIVFEWEATEQPTGTMEVGSHNFTAQAAVNGTLIENLFTTSDFGLLGAKNTTRPDVLLIYTRRAGSLDSATYGLAAWQQYIMPRSRMRWLGSAQWSERAETPDRFQVVINDTTKYPHGKALATGTHGAANAPIIPHQGAYRIRFHFFQGNASSTTTTLNYTPVSATDFEVYNFTTGAAVTGCTLNASTKVFTFGTAPAAAAKIGIMYRSA